MIREQDCPVPIVTSMMGTVSIKESLAACISA